jgi:class 3 adenylate cyclase
MFSRQKKLIETATKQNAIVSSLFPKSIQKKLMEDLEDGVHRKNNKSGTANLKRYLHGERDVPLSSMVGGDADGGAAGLLSKPIADLFPETTIMFADIAGEYVACSSEVFLCSSLMLAFMLSTHLGFTAWSSVREPSQVFTLLESIYCEFDAVANRRRVFKVEVVGDCYVAVAGLPDARPNHALVMAKFARDCVNLMATTTSKLEVTLGPDTGELMIRVGLHSGPVVAGVLRGDKSRFQLFGDTMNTASRMESTGVAGRIQVSKETAERIAKHGKEHWLVQRENKITAKGKGEMTTYFLNIPGHDAGSHGACSLGSSELVSPNESNVPGVKQSDPQELEAKRNRIADWTVEALTSLLKAILAHRKAENTRTDPRELIKHLEEASLTHSNVIDEVAEVVTLPNYHQLYHKNTQQTIELSQSVIEQLRHYVQMIASLYNDNPFHNFDHANHVVMSVNKLLSRITAPDLDVDEDGKTLHDHTYGITSDPLTWFACVFSALIHDVDHSGAPNSQLVKEKAPIAVLYNGKAVAEQNSFDIAWDLLMDPTYEDLRKVLYCNKTEFKRFRQLVVNSVMATDIVDIDLKNLRNARWEMAFKEDSVEGSTGSSPHSSASEVNRKATVVIEHLIQASDVAHTMQHWHVYRRWNEKFFMECYQAYLDGRAENNPATNWYKGEIGFFDFYIIPLAKKLKDCGVFGVSSDEYLSYALQNRKEWEERGEEIVAGMVKAVSEHQDLSQAQAKTIQSTGVGCLE